MTDREALEILHQRPRCMENPNPYCNICIKNKGGCEINQAYEKLADSLLVLYMFKNYIKIKRKPIEMPEFNPNSDFNTFLHQTLEVEYQQTNEAEEKILRKWVFDNIGFEELGVNFEEAVKLLKWFVNNSMIASGLIELKKASVNNERWNGWCHNGIPIQDKEFEEMRDLAFKIQHKEELDNDK